MLSMTLAKASPPFSSNLFLLMVSFLSLILSFFNKVFHTISAPSGPKPLFSNSNIWRLVHVLRKNSKGGIAVGPKALSLKSKNVIFFEDIASVKYFNDMGRSSLSLLTNKSQ